MKSKKLIGIYFAARHLGRWRFEGDFNHQLPLSGTDRLFLWLASALGGAGWGVELFCDNLPENAKGFAAFIRIAESLPNAVQLAAASSTRVLIANANDPDLFEAAHEATRLGLVLLLWDHNGPRRELIRILGASLSIARIVCVSHAQADEARHLDCFEKMSVIYNAVDLSFWHPMGSPLVEPTVVYLGSLTPSKGFQHLARAWPLIKNAHPTARLEVCGSARLYNRTAALGPLGVASEDFERTEIVPYLGRTRESTDALGVRFHGLTTPEQTKALLCRAWVGVVNPNIDSAGETFCVSAVEMQACGLPVVGGCVGGLLETVAHEHSGLLVHPEQLARTICSVLRDPTFQSRLSKGALTHASQFAPARVLGDWDNLLRDIYAVRKLRSPVFRAGPFKLRRYVKQSVRMLGLQRFISSRRVTDSDTR